MQAQKLFLKIMDNKSTKKNFTHLSFICPFIYSSDKTKEHTNCWYMNLEKVLEYRITFDIFSHCSKHDCGNSVNLNLVLWDHSGFLANKDNVIMNVFWDKFPLSQFTVNLAPMNWSNNKLVTTVTASSVMRSFISCIENRKALHVTLMYEVNHFEIPLFAQSGKKLLPSEEFSDLKIIVRGGIFDVHKIIVASRNDVIKKMIEHDMLEKNTNEIKLLEWNFTVVSELLNYLYTNECRLDNVVYDLFKLAHYLQIEDLQHLCINFLKNNISESNILKILELSNENYYDLNDLKQIADQFFESHIKKLIHKQEVLDYLIDIINENNVATILRLAYTYNKEKLRIMAIDFIMDNTKVLKLDNCRDLFKKKPHLLLKIIEYSSNKEN